MELKLMFGEYEITIKETGDTLSISAEKGGEVEEEFVLSKGDESDVKSPSQSDEDDMKGFDEFESDEDSDDESDEDWDEDSEDWDEDSEDDDDEEDDEDDDEDEDQDDEEEEDDEDTMKKPSGSKMVQASPKLESFQSFLKKRG